jgi:hypothetical protein
MSEPLADTKTYLNFGETSIEIKDKKGNKEISSEIEKYKNASENAKNCSTKKTGIIFKSRLTNTDKYNCISKFTTEKAQIKKEALNKLSKYYKTKLTKKVSKRDKTDKIIKKINKYTTILKEIYSKCNSTNNLTPEKIQSEMLSKYKDFRELNSAYINFIYKNRTNSATILNTLNQITGLAEAFRDTIKSIMQNAECK